MERPHVALFGNVSLMRDRCTHCDRMALVIRGVFQCCDRPQHAEAEACIRVCSPDNIRKGPSKKTKLHLLDIQDNSCAWCERRFGSIVQTKRGPKTIIVRWDHVLPHCFSQNNHDSNFVAACQFCNAWKSSLMFATDMEVRSYVAEKWRRAASKDMPEVSQEFRDKTRHQGVLLQCVPK